MAKYVAKVPIGGNSFRYFYSAEEYGAYKEQKSKAMAAAAEARIRKGKKKDLPGGSKKRGRSGGIKIPTGHITKASVGKVITGYNGSGKPEGMSDAKWATVKKMWGTTFGTKKKRPAQGSAAGQLALAIIKKKRERKSKHSSGNF